jgi:hypothetical protein
MRSDDSAYESTENHSYRHFDDSPKIGHLNARPLDLCPVMCANNPFCRQLLIKDDHRSKSGWPRQRSFLLIQLLFLRENRYLLDILFDHLAREIFGRAHRERQDGHRWVLPTGTHKARSIDNE